MLRKFLLVCTIACFFLSANLWSQNFPEMVFVKGGSFQMGDNFGDSDEKPVHPVTLTDYYIGKYEVTVAQYKVYCKETGKKLPTEPDKNWYEEHPNADKWIWRDNHPIVNITWKEASEYCEWLSGKTGQKFSLPTEAQWEYAARGGNLSKKYKFSGSNTANKVAWYDETTYEKGTQPVGQLKPNELGIFDMSGNAWEWCKDFFGRYAAGNQKNPTGIDNSPFRVIRGGSWYYVSNLARLTARDGPYPHYTNYNYGFRVARNP